jgi:hypothetical protein
VRAVTPRRSDEPNHPHHHPGEHPHEHPHRGRRRRLRNILIIVGVVSVVCCAGLIVASLFALRAGNSDRGAVRDAGDAFLSDLQDNKYPDAYNMLCASTRNGSSVDQFTRQVQSKPHIRGHQLGSVVVATVNGHSEGLVSVQLTRDDGTSGSEAFTLRKEGDAWKMCSAPPY